jgi:hypothetical protein
MTSRVPMRLEYPISDNSSFNCLTDIHNKISIDFFILALDKFVEHPGHGITDTSSSRL